MRQTILIFSAIAVSLLILLNLRKMSVMYGGEQQEAWTVGFALLFIVLGIIVSRVLKPTKVTQEEPNLSDPSEALARLGITQREYEVLRLVASGDSNLEISRKLFISESTVKTHVSNVLTKLDVKRRTQAVRKARELQLL